jgi:tetratricopeptide (TPR) repeat protein
VARKAAGGAGAETTLARADRLHAEGRSAEAAAAYREALAQGGKDWDRRPRAVESLVGALAGAGLEEECASAARAETPRLPRGSSYAAAASQGLECALGDEEGAWRKAARAELAPLVRASAGFPDLAADDRANALQQLADERKAAGDETGARKAAGRLWSFLVREARRTPSAELRASLDSFRVAAALALGDPGRAVPALRASEQALPDDYNPPARLALLYRELGRRADALAAADRALARAYGPRKIRIYDTKAGIQEKSGDRAGLEATLSEAVAFAASLPGPQASRVRRTVDRMRERLEKLRG